MGEQLREGKPNDYARHGINVLKDPRLEVEGLNHGGQVFHPGRRIVAQ
jgi:hypothetical protein